jgi:hypothetical protein
MSHSTACTGQRVRCPSAYVVDIMQGGDRIEHPVMTRGSCILTLSNKRFVGDIAQPCLIYSMAFPLRVESRFLLAKLRRYTRFETTTKTVDTKLAKLIAQAC